MLAIPARSSVTVIQNRFFCHILPLNRLGFAFFYMTDMVPALILTSDSDVPHCGQIRLNLIFITDLLSQTWIYIVFETKA